MTPARPPGADGALDGVALSSSIGRTCSTPSTSRSSRLSPPRSRRSTPIRPAAPSSSPGRATRAFAAGADISELAAQTPTSLTVDDISTTGSGSSAIRKPLIAAVRGFALGGGCELAMLCDMLVAGEDAQFGQPEIKLGVMPGAGGTQRLTRAIGKARAMELILTGRTIGAREADRPGLVSRVVPAEATVPARSSWRRRIAAMPPVAVLAAKAAVNRAEELPSRPGWSSSGGVLPAVRHRRPERRHGRLRREALAALDGTLKDGESDESAWDDATSARLGRTPGAARSPRRDSSARSTTGRPVSGHVLPPVAEPSSTPTRPSTTGRPPGTSSCRSSAPTGTHGTSLSRARSRAPRREGLKTHSAARSSTPGPRTCRGVTSCRERLRRHRQRRSPARWGVGPRSFGARAWPTSPPGPAARPWTTRPTASGGSSPRTPAMARRRPDPPARGPRHLAASCSAPAAGSSSACPIGTCSSPARFAPATSTSRGLFAEFVASTGRRPDEPIDRRVFELVGGELRLAALDGGRVAGLGGAERPRSRRPTRSRRSPWIARTALNALTIPMKQDLLRVLRVGRPRRDPSVP